MVTLLLRQNIDNHGQNSNFSLSLLIIIHRHNSTHCLIPHHYPEDSDVPLLYTPQTSVYMEMLETSANTPQESAKMWHLKTAGMAVG